jgi:hypothetical protein
LHPSEAAGGHGSAFRPIALLVLGALRLFFTTSG